MKNTENSLRSKQELAEIERLSELIKNSPIADGQLADNAALYLRRAPFSRILFLEEMYRLIVDVPGAIAQFGVRWGRDLSVLMNLRALFEPYNFSRRLYAFDTFQGLAGITDKDADEVRDGDFIVTPGYERHLAEVLKAHEAFAPYAHLQKHRIYAGDARETVKTFCEENPGEQLAMLYLDMDLYEPTSVVLKTLLPRLQRGSVVVFDEYSDERLPGEATLVRELAGACDLELRRSRLTTVAAHAIVR